MTWPDRGRKRGYGKNVLLGIDQLAATLIGIDCDESLSSYAGRKHYGEWQQKTIDWIFLKLVGETDHCLNNIEKEYLD